MTTYEETIHYGEKLEVTYKVSDNIDELNKVLEVTIDKNPYNGRKNISDIKSNFRDINVFSWTPEENDIGGTYKLKIGTEDTLIVDVLPTIPDSVVQRDADEGSIDDSGADTYNGIYVTTGSSRWPQIQGRISQKSVSLGNAVVVGPDDTIIQSVDVSALSAGDVVTFDNAFLSPSTEYRFALEKADSNTTIGYADGGDNSLFPYTSSDGELEMTAGWQHGTLVDDGESRVHAWGFSEIGNVTGTL